VLDTGGATEIRPSQPYVAQRSLPSIVIKALMSSVRKRSGV
jgi:hypothetical protein